MLKIDQETCLSFTHYEKTNIILVCSLYILSGLDSEYSRERFFENLIFRALPKHYEDPVLTKKMYGSIFFWHFLKVFTKNCVVFLARAPTLTSVYNGGRCTFLKVICSAG